jgi:hypothetical protein
MAAAIETELEDLSRVDAGSPAPDPFVEAMRSIELLEALAVEADRRAREEPDRDRGDSYRRRAARARSEADTLRIALLARF